MKKLDKAVKEAEQYAEQDKKRKEAVDVKNEQIALSSRLRSLLTN